MTADKDRLGGIIHVYQKYDPSSNPRHDQSEPVPFETEAAAKAAANSARNNYQLHSTKVMWAVAYPPAGSTKSPHFIVFPQ